MSGRRITKSERLFVVKQRRAVKQNREREFLTFGNNAETDRYTRQVARTVR